MGTNEDYPPCSARRRIVQFAADGTKTPIQRCGEATADMMGLTVLSADCDECPVRVVVTQAAMKAKEYQPPLVAEVTTVRGAKPDDGSDDRFLPCINRNLVEIGGCCGKSKDIRVCDSIDCWRLGSEVNPEMCRACTYRKDIPDRG